MIQLSDLAPASAGTLYGFSLGLVAAVNPCGFPLLPAYLAVSATDAAGAPQGGRGLRALRSGLLVTVGFIVVFGVLGVAIHAGVAVALGWVPWTMIPVGALLAGVGICTAAGRTLPVPVPSRVPWRGRHDSATLVGFGLVYAVASLSCSLPLFVAGVVGSFDARGSSLGVADAVAYAMGMGLVITAVSLAGAGARGIGLRRVRSLQPVLTRLAGGVMAVVGAYLVLYWVNDLVAPLSAPAPVRAVEGAQSAVANALAASPQTSGMVIGLVVLAVLGTALVHSARGPRLPAADIAAGERIR